MNRMKAAGSVGAALLICAASPSMLRAQQRPAGQTPAAQGPVTPRPTTMPQEPPRGQAVMSTRRSGALQGFSVVLVVGDLQGTSATDDVPIAARKALTDMREFLPYKSYRLLDAGWLMCCGERPGPTPSERRPSSEPSNLALRGPDDQEYELRLSSSRVENARVFVQFALVGAGAAMATASTSTTRTLQRRLADLEDKAEVLQKQIADAKRRVEVGVASGAELPEWSSSSAPINARPPSCGSVSSRPRRSGPAPLVGRANGSRDPPSSTRASRWTSAKPSSSAPRGREARPRR